MTEPATTIPTYSPPEQTLRPVMAHDGLTFDELARTYNFRKTSDRRLVFARLLVDELMHRGKPTRVLDIGCGSGFSKGPEFTWAVRQHATEMWGIEPDPRKSCQSCHGYRFRWLGLSQQTRRYYYRYDY
jgi:hypothetical protein